MSDPPASDRPDVHAEPPTPDVPADVPEVPADRPSSSPATKREVVATIAVVAALMGAVATAHLADRLRADATPEQCAALLDRYVEHRARAAQPEIQPSAVASQQVDVRQIASSWEEFAKCPDRLSQTQVECAMKSNNADEFERCLQ